MPKITVYTTSWCPWCDRLKAWLKEKKVEFEEKNIEKDEKAAREMTEKSGQQSVPVTDIDGTIIVGFDVPALKKTLNIKEQSL